MAESLSKLDVTGCCALARHRGVADDRFIRSIEAELWRIAGAARAASGPITPFNRPRSLNEA
jgi:hypothetical protein